MDDRLQEQFFSSMMCFKKLEAAFSLECEMQMNEMAILRDILGGCSVSGSSCTNLNVPKMQERLRISKPAVSYILNTLEKKNYIVREITQRTAGRSPSAPPLRERRQPADPWKNAIRPGRAASGNLARIICASL